MAKEHQNQIMLRVVVNGTPVELTANVHAPLHTVIREALRLSNNVGQPPENWELKDLAGNLLDPDKKVEDYNIAPGATLFLSLKAGAAGGH